ncbi:MAG TPA: hypothetical protein EYG86_02510 [Crocinitomicaceae bacterium]|nr:hypothetical protein [Crocinitomicaceae bacterium]
MYFIKLIRPINLLIVALTMYGLGWYFESIFGKVVDFGLSSLPFFLLVSSTILIAAAGNIINDYFDIKADRINKPERLIIGKHVKRRVAIVSHWGINFLAFSIAAYLSYVMNSFLYLFIHLLSINILWFYSMKGKRLFFTGNVLIALLTAMVTLLVGFYFHQVYAMSSAEFNSDYLPFLGELKHNYIFYISLGLACFAFILNLAREIVKDMEDVEGDKKLPAKTLPIVLGYAKSKVVAAVVLSGTIIGSFIIWLNTDSLNLLSLAPILLSAFFVVLCYVLLPKANSKKDYRRINHLIKLAMVSGMLTPIYWNLLVIYG